ncbi:MAG: alpha/beta hydrolase [Paludibacter sp.]|nr:alpha/beta hydrolase [Paludibacter sp.]
MKQFFKFLGLFYTVFLLSNCSSLPEPLSEQNLQNKYSETANWLILESKTETPTTGIIFYPGGLVDPHAYLDWLDKLISSNQKLLIVTVRMPANLAVLNAEGGIKVINNYPNISRWIIAGHSLGGTMAAQLISNHENDLYGLILLASYPANDALKSWEGAVLSVHASNDGLSTASDIELHKTDLPTATTMNAITDFHLPLQRKTHYFKIMGGNHAQFGNYGVQKNDSVASISREEQQNQVIGVISHFIENL